LLQKIVKISGQATAKGGAGERIREIQTGVDRIAANV
jgi:hypothetical protein